MESKVKNENFKVGDIISTPQGEKYQVLQRINSNKKADKQLLPTVYDHIDTFIVKRHSNKVYYILKRFHIFYDKSAKQSPIQSPTKQRNALKQIKNKQLFHPNLLIVEEFFFQKTQKHHKTLILIEQYCQQGDLANFVKYETKKCLKQGKKEAFSQKIISKWLLQILLALEHLHYHKSTHQVLSPNNIFLTPLGNLKLNEYYFLNAITATKDIRKQKDVASPLIEGYEPMVNEKKFRMNEKKDIFDFGILISFLCNLKVLKQPKKDDKSKGSVHLPTPYSQELNKIYLNCIHVKKTGIQVKDILRTPYFLEVMREFIQDKKLNIPMFERIPIKKYMIHKKSIFSKPQTSKISKKEDKQTIEVKLPRIEKTIKPSDMKQSNRKVQKKQTKEQTQQEMKKAMKASLEKLKNKLDTKLTKQKKFRKSSVDQTKDQKQIQRKSSKQKPKLLIPIPPPKDPSKNTLKPPPSLPKSKKTDSKSNQSPINQNRKQARSSRQQPRSRQKQKRERISRSESMSPQKTNDQTKKYHLTPQITFGKKTQNSNNKAQSPSVQIKQPNPCSQAQQQSQDSKLTQLQKISQNLAKIFSELKIREDDDQQLSFQLGQEEEQELRLTLKEQKQGGQSEENLMKTYKWKFDEIVSQLQQKYQPNLQTIIQKTNEWDSNDFFINQELLKRLRFQEGKQQVTFGS